ncbi:MAG: hypothetical protein KJO98_06700 [Rhodothermia bacterium]|nr:hypothetical protein [Rhodothermia bacterium]
MRQNATLAIVGIGLRGVRQVTDEAHDEIARADRILTIVESPETNEWVATVNPKAEIEAIGMVRWWDEDRLRGWVDDILGAMDGRHTVLVLEGHPGVCVPPTHILLDRARRRGVNARMLPGVSTFDLVCTEAGLDLVSQGCLVMDATEFLDRRMSPQPSCHLVLWQVGVVGDPVQSRAVVSRDGFARLVERLQELYPMDHLASIFEWSSSGLERKASSIGELGAMEVTERTTMIVPALKTREGLGPGREKSRQ